MKEDSGNKVPLLRMSQDDPLNPSSTNDQVDSNNNNLGESNMIKKKVIKNPKLLTMEECSGWSPLPIQKKHQVDSNNNNLGESNMIKEKVINNQ